MSNAQILDTIQISTHNPIQSEIKINVGNIKSNISNFLSFKVSSKKAPEVRNQFWSILGPREATDEIYCFTPMQVAS